VKVVDRFASPMPQRRAVGLLHYATSAMLPAMDANLAMFRRALESISAITDREWEQIRPHLSLRHFTRGSYLQSAKEPVGDVHFLVEGLVREYYTTADGREHVKSFVRAGSFTAAYGAYILARESHVWIQALEETRALVFPFAAFVALRETNLIWERINRHILEALFVAKEKREFQFLSMSASERYRLLLEDFPGIEDLVSQYHLASYLGVTPIALSRIRRRMRVANE
jgi:CRP-like cAMP-binding protein